MTTVMKPKPRPQPTVITIETEPTFNVGGAWIPVARDPSSQDREYIIRELRRETFFDAFCRVLIFGSLIAVISLAIAFLLTVTVLLIKM